MDLNESRDWQSQRHNTKLFIERYPDYSMFIGDDVTKKKGGETYYRDILKNIQSRTPISDLFFSSSNINHIKYLLCKLTIKKIKNEYNKNLNITPQSQSTQELLIAMRSLYLRFQTNPLDQYSKNKKKREEAINNEIIRINRYVIDDLFHKFYNNVLMEFVYIRDIGQMVNPLDIPQSDNVKGRNTIINNSMFI